jgi:hypothetical protein
LRLAATASEVAGKRLPVLAAVQARMAEAIGAGMGDQDWSAVADYTLRSSGSQMSRGEGVLQAPVKSLL